MTCRSNLPHRLLLKIILYWNTNLFLHLYITYGCFCTAIEELYSSNRDPPAHKAQHIYYLALYKRNLLTPSLNAAIAKKPKALERIGRPEI